MGIFRNKGISDLEEEADLAARLLIRHFSCLNCGDLKLQSVQKRSTYFQLNYGTKTISSLDKQFLTQLGFNIGKQHATPRCQDCSDIGVHDVIDYSYEISIQNKRLGKVALDCLKIRNPLSKKEKAALINNKARKEIFKINGEKVRRI